MDGATWAAVSAVIIDSLVTLFVGWRLNRTARQEVKQALLHVADTLESELSKVTAEHVQPALKEELSQALARVMPTISNVIVGKIAQPEAKENGTVRTIQSGERYRS